MNPYCAKIPQGLFSDFEARIMKSQKVRKIIPQVDTSNLPVALFAVYYLLHDKYLVPGSTLQHSFFMKVVDLYLLNNLEGSLSLE